MEYHERLFRSTSDLASEGVTRYQRDELLRSGALIRAKAGRYLVPQTDADPWHGRIRALLVRAGPSAVLSRSTAAAVWGFDGFAQTRELHVNVARSSAARGEATIHRVRRSFEIRMIDGLPVTGPAPTLLELGADLAPRLRFAGDTRPLSPPDLVELAVESALRRNLVELDDLTGVLREATAQHPGRAVLLEVLNRRPRGTVATESILETRFVQVTRDAGLPDFERQVWICDENGAVIGRVDFGYERLVVEADGESFHPDFSGDRERWVRLHEAGYVVRPVTHEHIEYRTDWLIDRLRTAIRVAQ